MIPSHWQTFQGCQSLLEFFDDLPDLKGERAVPRGAGVKVFYGSPQLLLFFLIQQFKIQNLVNGPKYLAIKLW